MKEAPGEAPELIRGVARERVVSVEDPQMRHGRKSKSARFDGYKRHVLRDLETGLVRAVGLTLANAPEASVAEDILRDLAHQPDAELSEVHIDRAYLSSELVRERPEGLEVYCKAWRVRNATGLYPKSTFELDWGEGCCAAQRGFRCPSSPVGWCVFPRRLALGVPCGSAAPRAREAAGA
jgi:hypothetical protein